MNTDIGKLIRQARLEKGLSQRALARNSGVALGTIRRIEAGEGPHYDFTLSKVARAVGLNAQVVEEASA